MRKAYQSDLSDEEWSFLEPHLPIPIATGRPKMHSAREILNALSSTSFAVVAPGGYYRMSSHPGRPSTITSVFGAWMEPGRGFTPPCASG